MTSDTRLFRTPLEVTHIADVLGIQLVEAVLPCWKSDKSVRFPVDLLGGDIQVELKEKFKAGSSVWLFAKANMLAENASELRLQDFEIAPDLDDSDGLA